MAKNGESMRQTQHRSTRGISTFGHHPIWVRSVLFACKDDSDWEDGGPIWGENPAAPTKHRIFPCRKWNLDGSNHPKLVWIFFAKTMAGPKYTPLISWNGCFPNLFNWKWENYSLAGLSYCMNNNEQTSYHLSDIPNMHINGWSSTIILYILRLL